MCFSVFVLMYMCVCVYICEFVCECEPFVSVIVSG